MTRSARKRPRRQPNAAVSMHISREDWVLRTIIIAAAAVTFAPALWGGFTNWDDDLNVTGNPFVQSPGFIALKFVWTHAVHHLYIPLVYTSYMVDWSIGGGKPYFFHLTNLILHAANSLLVFELIRRLGRPVDTRAGRLAIAAAAVLFAIHPLQVETVAWVTGRKDLLASFFSFLSLWFYLQASDNDRLNLARYSAAVGAFVLALLCKPAVVALPVGIMFMDLWLRKLPVRRLITHATPLLIIAAAFALITSRVQPVPEWFTKTYPIWWRPFVASDALLFYLQKLIAPVGLAPIYARPPASVMEGWWAYASLPVILALAGIIIWRGGVVAAGTGFAVALLLPVLGIVPYLYLSYSTVADHYMYLPMFGICLIAAHVLRGAGERWTTRPRHLAIAVSAALVLLAALAHAQTYTWLSSVRLWERSLAIKPNVPEEHYNYAQTLLELGKAEEAIRHYQAALALRPDFGEALNALALEKMKQGQQDEAIAMLDKAIESHRKYGFRDERLVGALNNKAVILIARQQANEAEVLLKEALEIKPLSYESHTNMALVLAQKRDITGAKLELEKALEIQPGDPKATELLRLAEDDLARMRGTVR